jgi:hypothetical protein
LETLVIHIFIEKIKAHVMLSNALLNFFIVLCFFYLFQPIFLFAEPKFLDTDQSVYFLSTSLGADFTIHFSSSSLGADKTIKIVNSPENADLSIGITNNNRLANYYFKIVNSSLGDDITINISNTSLGADETIYLTDYSISIDLNVYFTTNLDEADIIISSNVDFLPPKHVLAILSSIDLLDEDNIEIIKELFKNKKSNNLEKQGKQINIYKEVTESQIDGEFKGWEGETIIKLVNGDIWIQNEYHYHYHYSYRPKVIIYKTDYGYKMKVDGSDKAVRVKQLR